ncbi:unnamed protein product [Paramecium sonneborni]|uniref:Uncharacterized protein n=1 Tax=Paramecium sonneborni TaxID=65129 RepID=A0A8S1PW02_9CILI|nr:unnamed protein product [Paramecium sonneborni]
MKREFCQIQGHDTEELIYVCDELQCIELNNNKLICQKCLCIHRGVTYNILKEKAIKNYNQYTQILQNDIDENESLKKNVEQSIKEIQGKIMKMMSDLQKNIFTFVDGQSQKLLKNKNQAQQLMQDSNSSLDIQIFFAKFSERKTKEKQETTKQQVKAIIKDLIDDINLKIEYLKQPDVNEYKIIEFELQSFQIESIFQKKLPYSYCDEHCSNKTSICVDIKCLESSYLEYYCLRCCKSSHVQHYQNDYLVEYDKLKKEQKVKQKFVVNQKQKMKEYVQKLVNDSINQLKIEQKEQYLKYEITIENIKSLQQQFEINLQVENTKYVFGDLLLQFINTKEETFLLQLNQVQQNFEDKLQCCKIQDKQKFLEECQLLQLKQDEIVKLQKNIKQLKQSVDQKDQLLNNQSSENLFNLLQMNLKEKDKLIQSLSKNNETLQQKVQQQQSNQPKEKQQSSQSQSQQKQQQIFSEPQSFKNSRQNQNY